MRTLVSRICRFVTFPAVVFSFTAPSLAAEARGTIELGIFMPYVAFDAGAPIRDLRGENDAIRSEFGRGIITGYNFPHGQAIESQIYWVNSDSEDMNGANHFSILTRYLTLGYRKNWRWPGDIDPFFTVGLGDFYAHAQEVNHQSFSERAAHVGFGIRYSPERRSSIRIYFQEMLVDTEPKRSSNYIIAGGAVFYIGRLPGAGP